MPEYVTERPNAYQFVNDQDAETTRKSLTSGHHVEVSLIDLSSGQHVTKTLYPGDLPNYDFPDDPPSIRKLGI